MFWKFNFHFDEILFKNQSGVSKQSNAQHCLASMIEKWKESVDTGRTFAALMTDFSKDLDHLHHELLIAKADTYDFDLK